MANRRYSIGIRVEGIGSDPLKTEGICWFWGLDLSSAQKAASNFEWVGGYSSRQGLITAPKNVPSSVDVFTAELQTGGHTMPLHWEALSVLSFIAPPTVPVHFLVAGIGDSTTAIKFSSGLNATDNGTVVWLGDEAIKLGTFNGTDTFNTCVRGYWGTQARAWTPRISVYQRNPLIEDRQVQILRFDHADDSEEVLDRLFLDEVNSSNDGTTINLKCREVIAALKQARINKGSPDLASIRDHMGSGRVLRQPPGEEGLTGNVSPRVVRVLKDNVLVNFWGTFQVGESAYSAEFNNTFGVYRFTEFEDFTSRPILGGPPPDPAVLEPVYELVYISRLADTVNGELVAVSDRKSATGSLTHPLHPMSLVFAYFLSNPTNQPPDAANFEIFNGDFMGLNIDADWIDLVDVKATIERTNGTEMDQYIGGWNGEEIVPWDVMKQLCRTYGFFPARTSSGKLTVKEFRDAGIQQVATAPSVVAEPFTLKWAPSRADSVDVIAGIFGKLPWNDGTPFSIQHIKRSTVGDDPAPAESKRKGIFGQERELKYDMPTRSDVGEFSADLVMLALARHFASPRLHLRVADVGFGHGEFVRIDPLGLKQPWAPDSDGTLTTIDATDATWVGLVISRRRILDEGAADIVVLLTNHGTGAFARYRAPSGEIESFSTTTMTFTQFAFHDSGDGIQFNDADKVQLYNASGGLKSQQVKTVQSNTTHTLVLDTAWDNDPVAGDVVRLAFLDDGTNGYPSGGQTGYAPGDPIDGFDAFLAYAYHADTDDEISPDDIAGHIYGSGAGS